MVSAPFLELTAAALAEADLALFRNEAGELPVQSGEELGTLDAEFTRQREGEPDLCSVVSQGLNTTLTACPQLRAYGLSMRNRKSDRRGSNPRPSLEPQTECRLDAWPKIPSLVPLRTERIGAAQLVQ